MIETRDTRGELMIKLIPLQCNVLDNIIGGKQIIPELLLHPLIIENQD